MAWRRVHIMSWRQRQRSYGRVTVRLVDERNVEGWTYVRGLTIEFDGQTRLSLAVSKP